VDKLEFQQIELNRVCIRHVTYQWSIKNESYMTI